MACITVQHSYTFHVYKKQRTTLAHEGIYKELDYFFGTAKFITHNLHKKRKGQQERQNKNT